MPKLQGCSVDWPGTLPPCTVALDSVSAPPTAAHIKLDVAAKYLYPRHTAQRLIDF